MERIRLFNEAGLAIANYAAKGLQQDLCKLVQIEEVVAQGNTAVVKCDSKAIALHLRDNCHLVADIAGGWWFERCVVRWPGCANPYQILSSLGSFPRPEGSPGSSPGFRNLTEASHEEILEFLLEMARDGLVVVICSLRADMGLLYVNNRMESCRSVITPADMLGLDNPHLWRETMDNYDRLKYSLITEKFLPEFSFAHYRADNSFCQFQTSFYYCQNYLGVPVRIGVSQPEAWEVVRSAVRN